MRISLCSFFLLVPSLLRIGPLQSLLKTAGAAAADADTTGFAHIRRSHMLSQRGDLILRLYVANWRLVDEDGY